ncbi:MULTISPECIES: NarK family nitrate/nitrite MFS transporter [unclassified Spirosoma]|uniref:NarK family nitrate/nitrite MFS transporter n=1 Tax=unclassified Spirosoma TaxID=2621999 RepID=UPI00095EEEA9|nr:MULTISPECIES: NarK family nitrate/nitrite MFS transporter [unclassified Spirosoma]MBN8824043.1 NarK family nitrate/nitrite MFS transporter [Spirosoma sp.]OJW70445.1 MAG: MFS transporter [Spirosoma sp. 48-14]
MNTITNKPLSSLNVLNFKGVQMRTFHITWFTFFVCFFGWFGLAPLMPAIREDLGLTKPQVGNTIIAAVSATILARLIIGRLCDTWGPRKTYTALLVIGSLPVMLVGLAHDYTTFLLFRLAIGIIGASFVITQYHTSVMFAPGIKGTANAVAGGWGNLGGGITQLAMPLIMATIVGFGYTKPEAWRLAMVVPGVLMLIMAYVYYRFTQDTPAGNVDQIERSVSLGEKVSFWKACADIRVWALALAYACCFGMEITFDGVAALYFFDNFKMEQTEAGFWAMLFGFMNIFARALGGIVADRVGKKYGMRGKGVLLAGMLLLEGLGIILFAQAGSLPLAIASMLTFALFLKMSNGGTYAIVPFVNPKAIGVISGVVGAGGNLGGMLMGFLFKSQSISYGQAFLYIGCVVAVIGAALFLVNFNKAVVVEEAREVELQLN